MPDPTRRRRSFDYWLMVLGAVFLGFGLVLTTLILRLDHEARPSVSFQKSDWKISFEMPQADCDRNRLAAPACPPHPENTVLWESPLNRESDQFIERYEHGMGSPFWTGLKITPAQLKEASLTDSTTFALPKFNGVLQVWIDGVYQMTYDGNKEKLPAQIEVTLNRLKEEKPLSLVIGVFPYPHQGLPEASDVKREGFFTSVNGDRLSRSSVFVSISRHLIAVAVFVLLSIILWSASAASRTRDYTVAAQVGFLMVVISLLSSDLSFRVFNVQTYEAIYLSSLILEAALLVRFTWTILKGTKQTGAQELCALVFLTIVPSLVLKPDWIEVYAVNFVAKVLLPLVYLGSALAIGLRLKTALAADSTASRTRIEFLLFVSFTMLTIGLAYLVESHGQSGFQVVWSRWFNILWMLALVRVFTISAKTKSSLIELAPMSSHHRKDPLPDRVEGWVVNLEILDFIRDRQVLSTILSHLWTISQLNDGEVLRAEGRRIQILFASGASHADDANLTAALSQMAKCMKDLEHRLPILSANREATTSILYRASAVRGAIRPAWNTGETGVAKIPRWLDIEGEESLRKSQELLETDADTAIRSEDASVIIFEKQEAIKLIAQGTLSERAKVAETATAQVFVATRIRSRLPRAS